MAMDKKHTEIIITSFLIVLMIFAWASTIKKLKQKGVAKTAGAPTLVEAKKEVAQQAEQEIKEEGLEWQRDPFSGKVYYSQIGSLELELTGILWDPQNPEALINDKICGKGDRIGGFQVIEIRENKVILSDGARQIELKLN